MKEMLFRYFKLIFGFFVFALGVVITMHANLGYAPWDVFHQGIANIMNVKIGTINIMVALILIIIEIIIREKIGIGSIGNMYFIGTFINLILDLNIIPISSNVYIGLLMIFIGMVAMGIGTWLYIGAGFGIGPRDVIMILFMRKTGRSLGFIRNSIEVSVLILGYLLGGPVGIGTVLISLGLGPVIQMVFAIVKFDSMAVEHRGLDTELEAILSIAKRIRENKDSVE